MNIKWAIIILKHLKHKHAPVYDRAIDMAIEALEVVEKGEQNGI